MYICKWGNGVIGPNLLTRAKLEKGPVSARFRFLATAVSVSPPFPLLPTF